MVLVALTMMSGLTMSGLTSSGVWCSVVSAGVAMVGVWGSFHFLYGGVCVTVAKSLRLR